MKKSTPLWCEDCRFVCFETGLGKPMLTLNDPNGLKNTTNVYFIHLELRMALPCQISTGKWKYVNPCLDFLGTPDLRTAYVKRQARPRWTYVRRSSVTLDLTMERTCWSHVYFCSSPMLWTDETNRDLSLWWVSGRLLFCYIPLASIVYNIELVYFVMGQQRIFASKKMIQWVISLCFIVTTVFCR